MNFNTILITSEISSILIGKIDLSSDGPLPNLITSYSFFSSKLESKTPSWPLAPITMAFLIIFR